MHPLLRSYAAEQGGSFTRAQAREADYSERQLKTLTRPGGEWTVLRRGVYAEGSMVATLSEDERYLLGVHAVVLSGWSGATVSHTSAAVVHGLPIRPRWRRLHHVTRPDVLGGRTESGVTHHRAHLADLDLAVARGLTVTGLARTAVDIARLHGFASGVVAADAALRRGATPSQLSLMVERGRNWPHNTQARAAVRVADAGADGIGESLLRLMVLELRIGVPETQFRISDGNRTAYADIRVGRHLFEFDGRVKYLPAQEGGVATRPAHEVVWAEKQREDWLRRTAGGFGVSRVVWPELFGAARARTLRRLAQEYAATVHRFGRAGLTRRLPTSCGRFPRGTPRVERP